MEAADIAQVQALAESLPEAPHWPMSAWQDACNSRFEQESSPRRIALVAACPPPGCIVGFAVASLLPPQAELETIAVAPESRRQGLGRIVFQAMKVELEALGASEILLEVRSSNHPAQAFYRTLGFSRTGFRSGYYADPVEDAVLMRLALMGDFELRETPFAHD